MTLHMDIQTTPTGSFTELDLVEWRVAQVKLQIGYSHPASLSWLMYRPQQSLPLGIGNFIRFWDDDYGTRGNPQFEGFLDDVSPGTDANMVACQAHDSSAKAAKEIVVMSAPWRTVDDEIVEGLGAIPRLVYNCKIDNDDDYAHERAHDGTTGEIMAGILEDALLPLRYFHAAPSDSQAYVWDGGLADFTYRPQEKMVFESESIRTALDSLLQWEPAVKLLFVPGDNADGTNPNGRKWLFQNLYNGASHTFTLNDFADDHPVLSLELRRSMVDRATAVTIYGPPTTELRTFSTLDGGLTPTGPVTVLESYTDVTGLHEVQSVTSWQITDPDKRRGARLLPEEVYAPVAPPGIITVPTKRLDQWYVVTRSPHLQLSWDGGTTWGTIQGVRFDFQNGIASTGAQGHVFARLDPPPISGSSQHVFIPNAFRLVWASYVTPLSVRFPASGFSGTAFDVANTRTTLQIYDEMLAVDYVRGVPITTEIRLAQFARLAEIMQFQRRDIIYAGGCVLEGIAYDFQRLFKRVNFAAVDQDGTALETGWENVQALLTDVEYDYDQGVTTLQFSSDQLELIGMSPEFLKARLKIKALQRVGTTHLAGFIAFGGNSLIYTVDDHAYVDPDTGQLG